MKILLYVLSFCFVCSLTPTLEASHDIFFRGKTERALDIYFLPVNHPLQTPLNTLLTSLSIFRSPSSLRKEGFSVKEGHQLLMVAAHPAIQGYLIKKFSGKKHTKKENDNFLKRLKGAEKIRQAIQQHKCKHLVVPEKWIYSIDSRHSYRKYFLIVEDMDVYDWDDPKGELENLYYNMDIEILKELCTVLHAVGGCDAFPRNQPFTRSGKIAFVDTEHVGEKKDYFLIHIVPALNNDLQKYAIDLWAGLEEESRR